MIALRAQLSAFADTVNVRVSAKADSCARSAIIDPQFIVGDESEAFSIWTPQALRVILCFWIFPFST